MFERGDTNVRLWDWTCCYDCLYVWEQYVIPTSDNLLFKRGGETHRSLSLVWIVLSTLGGIMVGFALFTKDLVVEGALHG